MALDDQCLMAHALALGRRNLGMTWPNPSVGCVLVAGEGGEARIIARGWTRWGGRPHGETMALAAAGERARGATAYVSLEPCSHHGITPPCVDALIAAGVSRVVSAIEDPDPRVAGRGHQRLRDAGIDVVTGIGEDDARRDHAGFLSRVLRRRPWVHLKLAVSRDGMIAGEGPDRTIITGDLAQARGHLIRAFSDAVLIGAGTARADDPMLTCRLPGLEDRSPVRIVADSGANLDPGSKLARTARDVPVWVMCGEDADRDRRAALEAAGVTVLVSATGASGRLDPGKMLEHLADRGLTWLMVEGGAELAAALVNAALIDEVSLFEAETVIGKGGKPALAGLPLEAITRSGDFRVVEQLPLGPDKLTRYIRRRA